jgi:hypothetical protein
MLAANINASRTNKRSELAIDRGFGGWRLHKDSDPSGGVTTGTVDGNGNIFGVREGQSGLEPAPRLRRYILPKTLTNVNNSKYLRPARYRPNTARESITVDALKPLIA